MPGNQGKLRDTAKIKDSHKHTSYILAKEVKDLDVYVYTRLPFSCEIYIHQILFQDFFGMTND